MPRLRVVEVWPATRHVSSPWHQDENLAAFLTASRGVCEAYGAELAVVGQQADASLLRLLLDDARPSVGFVVHVDKRYLGGFDTARVGVPHHFARLTDAQRALAVLDVLDAAARALAEARGWPAARLHEVRRQVQHRGLRFHWATDWKANPGRQHRARALYAIDDDGNGLAQLEIQRVQDRQVVARSEPTGAPARVGR